MKYNPVNRLTFGALGTSILLAPMLAWSATPLFEYHTQQTSQRMQAGLVDLAEFVPAETVPVVKRGSEDRATDAPTDPWYQPICHPQFTNPQLFPFECDFTATNPWFFPLDCQATDPQWSPFCDAFTDPFWSIQCQTDPIWDPFCMTDPMYDTACGDAAAEDLPTSFALAQNHPNPFNPGTVIDYSLAETTDARLSVYDLQGREVAVLATGLHESGHHRVAFDGSALASGVYIYSLVTPEDVLSRKMILLK